MPHSLYSCLRHKNEPMVCFAHLPCVGIAGLIRCLITDANLRLHENQRSSLEDEERCIIFTKFPGVRLLNLHQFPIDCQQYDFDRLKTSGTLKDGGHWYKTFYHTARQFCLYESRNVTLSSFVDKILYKNSFIIFLI